MRWFFLGVFIGVSCLVIDAHSSGGPYNVVLIFLSILT